MINGKPATEEQKKHLWKKGESGNPAGMIPGKFSLVTMLKAKLKEVPPGQVKTYGEQFVDIILKKGIVDEDPKTLQLIINYIDGLPRQRIGIEGGEEGSPFTLTHEVSDKAKEAIKQFLTPDETDTTGNPTGK